MAPQNTYVQDNSQQTVLKWEHPDGEPEGTGICLAGGGIRAAMYALGVLQVMQERRGLVFGRNSADYLSVVSGGSYMAGTHTVGALARARDAASYGTVPPVAKGSPEERHVLANGQYLRKNLVRYLGFAALNFISVFTLFSLLALILACLAGIQHGIRTTDRDGLGWLADFYAWLDRLPALLPIAGFLLFFWLTMWAYTWGARWYKRVPAVIAFLVLAAICLYPSLQFTATNPDFQATDIFWGLVVFLFDISLLVAGIALALNRVMARKAADPNPALQRLSVGLNWVALYAPRVLAFAFIAWIAVFFYPDAPVAIGRNELSELDGMQWTLLIASLVFPVGLGGLPAALHREYRQRLMSCYAVSRQPDGGVKVADDELISRLENLDGDGDLSYPRLLISATANVRPKLKASMLNLPARVQEWMKSTTFLPYILSYDQCGSPRWQGSEFDTTALEAAKVRTRALGNPDEPLLTLFTAIACTGAAVSPNMGYKTVPSIRPFIAALNFRLGRWLPNPFNDRAQRALANLPDNRELQFGSAFSNETDELMTEIVGLYGPRMYISDGGHYDNLGLLALLRARCETIYCVDAGSDPAGIAGELHRLLAQAVTEGMIHSFDFSDAPFRPNGSDRYASTHRVGTITYADGETAMLVVLKLGLVEGSEKKLTDRADANRNSFAYGRWAHLGLLGIAAVAGVLAVGIWSFNVIPWLENRWNPSTALDWTAGIALAVMLAALGTLLFVQGRVENSALKGFFPHHETFTALWFNEGLATAYRDAGRAVAERFFPDAGTGSSDDPIVIVTATAPGRATMAPGASE